MNFVLLCQQERSVLKGTAVGREPDIDLIFFFRSIKYLFSTLCYCTVNVSFDSFPLNYSFDVHYVYKNRMLTK